VSTTPDIAQAPAKFCPAGWTELRLDEIADVDPDNLSASTSPDYVFKYISLDDVDHGQLTAYRELRFRDAPSRARRRLQMGDVLLATVRPNLLSHLLVAWPDSDWVCSTGFAVTRCREGIAVPGFVYAHLFGAEIRRQIDRLLTGSNYPAISSDDVRSLVISVPPYDEQLAIAGVLSDAENAIAALSRLIDKKQAMRRGVLQQLLTRAIRLPAFARDGDWRLSTVGAQFDIQLGKMLDAARNLGELKPYIGNRAVQWNRIDASAVGYVRLSARDMERFELKRGDLLICEGGEIGRAALWDAPLEECYYQKALHRLRPRGTYNARFLMYLFEFWARSGRLDQYVTQTSIAHLVKEKLEAIQIPVPNEDEQEAIVSVLADAATEIRVLEERRTKNEALKQGMMQALLSGRVRLPISEAVAA